MFYSTHKALIQSSQRSKRYANVNQTKVTPWTGRPFNTGQLFTLPFTPGGEFSVASLLNKNKENELHPLHFQLISRSLRILSMKNHPFVFPVWRSRGDCDLYVG